MKVVINNCFGGFGLSLIAQKRLMELKGKEVYFYKQTKYSWQDGFNQYTKMTDLTMKDLFVVSTNKDLGEQTESIPNEAYVWVEDNLERTDNDLIQVVQELKAKASGNYASLKIVDIPDDVEWYIDEYDGIETIEEKHRSWS